jgi:ankyrin repeat protein
MAPIALVAVLAGLLLFNYSVFPGRQHLRSFDGGYSVLGAVNSGDLAALKRAIANRAGLDNTNDGHFRTPVMIAAGRGDLDMVRALTQAGADIDMRKDNGATALIDAAYGNHRSTVDYLLSQHADVGPMTDGNDNALAWAAQYGMAAEVDEMASRGAYLSVRDSSGLTPLGRAVGAHHADVVAVLRQRGAE